MGNEGQMTGVLIHACFLDVPVGPGEQLLVAQFWWVKRRGVAGGCGGGEPGEGAACQVGGTVPNPESFAPAQPQGPTWCV